MEALEASRAYRNSHPDRPGDSPSPSDGCFQCGGRALEKELPATADQGRPQGRPGRQQGTPGSLLPFPNCPAVGKWRRPGPSISESATGPTQSYQAMERPVGSGRRGVPSHVASPIPDRRLRTHPGAHEDVRMPLEGRQGHKRPAPVVEADGWLKVPGMPSLSPALERVEEEGTFDSY